MTTKSSESKYPEIILSREEDIDFPDSRGLPNPSHEYFIRNGINFTGLLQEKAVTSQATALLSAILLKRSLDHQMLVDVFACALFSDNSEFTAYNSLALLEYFTRTRYSHHLNVQDYVSAVAGLSMHNGSTGSCGMHRLIDPDEIAGAATVIMFIGSMDREKYSKVAKMDYVGSTARSRKELALRNRHLDQLLRLNPEHLDSVRDYLIAHPDTLTTTRKSLQPVIERLHAEGMTVRTY